MSRNYKGYQIETDTEGHPTRVRVTVAKGGQVVGRFTLEGASPQMAYEAACVGIETHRWPEPIKTPSQALGTLIESVVPDGERGAGFYQIQEWLQLSDSGPRLEDNVEYLALSLVRVMDQLLADLGDVSTDAMDAAEQVWNQSRKE